MTLFVEITKEIDPLSKSLGYCARARTTKDAAFAFNESKAINLVFQRAKHQGYSRVFATRNKNGTMIEVS